MHSCQFRLVTVFSLAAAVLAGIHDDISRAIQCVKDQKISDEEIFQQSTECYKKQLQSTHKTTTDYIEDTIKKVCRLEDPTYCFMKHTETFRQHCLSQSLNEMIHRVLQAANAGHKYACHNDSTRSIEFYKNGGVQCIINLFNDHDKKMSSCVSSQLGVLRDELVAAGEDKDKQYEVECRFGYHIKRCILESMTSCDKAREIMNGFMDVMFKASHCPKYSSSGRLQVPSVLMFALSLFLFCFFHRQI